MTQPLVEKSNQSNRHEHQVEKSGRLISQEGMLSIEGGVRFVLPVVANRRATGSLRLSEIMAFRLFILIMAIYRSVQTLNEVRPS